MLLTADIGNTNIKLGVFEGGRTVHTWRLASDTARTEDELGMFIQNLLLNARLQGRIHKAAVSSTQAQLTDSFEEAVIKYLKVKPLIISHKIKLNFKLKVDTPAQLGADRIANAAAVTELYPLPAIAADFGTASVFDVINAEKEFAGGIITAGMMIQLEALAGRTSKLPKLKIAPPHNVIGRNTIDAMLSGTVRGHAAMIDGLLTECEKELGQKAYFIGTGGCSSLISAYMKRGFDCINPDLTLQGLKILYDLNCSG